MSSTKLATDNRRNALSALGRRFMFTESEWNPKVLMGRVLTALLPTKTLHSLKKSYYCLLLRHLDDSWQERDAVLLKYLVHPGDCVLDIGASIGGFTKLLSRIVGSQGRVYSFEPNPTTYDFLAYNVLRLGLDNVEPFQCALSDAEGTLRMTIPHYRWGSECHYDATLENGSGDPDCRKIPVRATTMDAIFAAETDRIVFIKCDVNYHELACLVGGLQTLSRFRPALLIEILPNPDRIGSPAARVFDLLSGTGYCAYWFDGHQLRKRQIGERSQNYFFLTDEHVRALPSELLFRNIHEY
jgi:FkbM family methyltransferase